MRLTATTTPEDLARTYRLMLAWVTGDRLALDAVLAEDMGDPAGTPGLVFATVEFATSLGEQVAPDLPTSSAHTCSMTRPRRDPEPARRGGAVGALASRTGSAGSLSRE